MHFIFPSRMKRLVSLLIVFMCFIADAQQTHFLWAKPFKGQGSEYSVAEVCDPQGNMYTTGYFEDSIWFEPGNDNSLVMAEGLWNSDVFVAKYHPDGSLIWVKSFGGMLSDEPTSITLSNQGDVFITGTFMDQADFDPSFDVHTVNSAGARDGFILQLNTKGEFKKVLTYGSSGYDRIMALSLQDTLLYAIGDFQQTVDFDPLGNHVLKTALGESDVCVLKMNLNGQLIWMKQLAGIKSEYGTKIATDSQYVFCGGIFEKTTDFDPSPGMQQNLTAYPASSTQGSPYDIFILCLAEDGHFVWVKQIGGIDDQELTDIKVHQSALYVTYNFNFQTYSDLPSTTNHVLQPSGDYDMAVQQFNEQGLVTHLMSLGGMKSDYIAKIQFDANGSLYVCGFFSSTCDFDPNPNQTALLTVNSFDCNGFLLKLNPDYSFRWVKQWKDDAFSAIVDVWIDDLFDIYSVGHWTGRITMDPDLGNNDVQSAGYYDGFLHKMSQCDPVDSSVQLTGCDSLQFHTQWYTQSGQYQVVIQNPRHCDTTFLIDILLHKTDSALYHVEAQSCGDMDDGMLILDVMDPHKQYRLAPGNHPLQGNTFTALHHGTYRLIIEDENPCTRIEKVEIPTKSCCDEPYIPQAFTPNQDGLNDYLNILNVSQAEVKQFSIYNRFGNEVFTNQNLWGWDGKYRGNEAEIGTYFYYLRYTCLQSKKEYVLKGSFELIR